MSRSVSRLLLVVVNIICIVNVYCGFNGTNIEPREQNPINHQFMLWNKLNFVCMTCFNESGNIYYYHPKINFTDREEINASVLVKLVGVEPTLQFYHNNKSFVFVNNSNQVSLVGEKFLVNESLYFDGMGPYRLSILSQMNKTNAFFQFNTSNSGLYIRDTHYSWLDSPHNSTIVLGPLFTGPHYFRFINYANGTVSPVVALRFNNLSSLGYPRYFSASKEKVCPTKAPLIVTQTCKPQIKTVTVIKTITSAKEDNKKITTATPSEPPQLLECKQQLNVFIVLFVVVSCLFLLVIMIMMCRFTNQAQKQAKSSVY